MFGFINKVKIFFKSWTASTETLPTFLSFSSVGKEGYIFTFLAREGEDKKYVSRPLRDEIQIKIRLRPSTWHTKQETEMTL